jgi:hypothetical protein
LFTVRDSDPDVAVKVFESVTVNLSPEVVTAALGMPVMAPVEVFKDAHDGRVPEVSAQCV